MCQGWQKCEIKDEIQNEHRGVDSNKFPNPHIRQQSAKQKVVGTRERDGQRVHGECFDRTVRRERVESTSMVCQRDEGNADHDEYRCCPKQGQSEEAHDSVKEVYDPIGILGRNCPAEPWKHRDGYRNTEERERYSEPLRVADNSHATARKKGGDEVVHC